jgi:preprotein translocase subunit SecE
MSEQAEVQQASGLDTAKLVAASALVVAGIVAYYWFDAQTDWLRYGYVLGGIVLGLLLAWQTEIGRNTWTFILTSRNEVRKMVWPSREETLQTAAAVIFVALLTAVLMWLLDVALFYALAPITGQGG